ncbi:MAG: hypothetical protein GY822_04635 [Deltaproteobacteria bacterium]|nr:hypothetical protein [Deltaproteobacteria bacterium]
MKFYDGPPLADFEGLSCSQTDFSCMAKRNRAFVLFKRRLETPMASLNVVSMPTNAVKKVTSLEAQLIAGLRSCAAPLSAHLFEESASSPMDGLTLQVKNTASVSSTALTKMACKFVEKVKKKHAPWPVFFSVTRKENLDAKTQKFQVLAWVAQIQSRTLGIVGSNTTSRSLLATADFVVGPPPKDISFSYELCFWPKGAVSTSDLSSRSEFCSDAVLRNGKLSVRHVLPATTTPLNEAIAYSLIWRQRTRFWRPGEGGFSPWESLHVVSSQCVQIDADEPMMTFLASSACTDGKKSAQLDDERLHFLATDFSRARFNLADALLERTRKANAVMPKLLAAAVLRTNATEDQNEKILENRLQFLRRTHPELTSIDGFTTWREKRPALASKTFQKDRLSEVALFASAAEHQNAQQTCFKELPMPDTLPPKIAGCSVDKGMVVQFYAEHYRGVNLPRREHVVNDNYNSSPTTTTFPHPVSNQHTLLA